MYFPVTIWDLLSCISVLWPIETSGLHSPQGLGRRFVSYLEILAVVVERFKS